MMLLIKSIKQTDMTDKLQKIMQRIADAAKLHDRDASTIRLVGASKMQTAETVRQFYQAGLKSVGENYLQEAINKQDELKDCDLQWHFIGGIQSNKTNELAQHFDWIQGVDRLKIANRLNHQRIIKTPLKVLIQLNVEDEDSKQGVSSAQAQELCLQITDMENLQLRGFMLIPKPESDFDKQRQPYSKARTLLENINQKHNLGLDTLSMGMSSDLEAAIAEGSTMVRIGTDLFGPRPSMGSAG